ncbi:MULTISPECIES: aminoglycoside phosphotransferase family protein [unclassified Cobetia]|uniref:aminoglycoside phosphotransferase family protein n=1 Tax=unclassified Cobetia TaxID=2609414 RepID=UPI00178CB773|nr:MULTISPECIES: aminoglycoside phosphotransferase family protein [unclassified Cobetia]MBE2168012.1 aminoglycoside phosphotransferase family protein [Cobetia sp. 2AS1]MDH2446435.1 aminoglycoside phosphotransferase family protein [Cobetia sp. 2AS]
MDQAWPESTRDNLRFLCSEVDSQYGWLQAFVSAPTAAMARKLLERQGYAENLCQRIEQACPEARNHKRSHARARFQQSLVEVASGLARLSELARSCLEQLIRVDDVQLVDDVVLVKSLRRVRRGILRSEMSLENGSLSLALKLARSREKLKRDSEGRIRALTGQLKKKSAPAEDLTHLLFVAREISQMGEVLGQLGEAVISATLGQSLNFERYASLTHLVNELGDGSQTAGEMRVDTLAETRSGSRISGIASEKPSERAVEKVSDKGNDKGKPANDKQQGSKAGESGGSKTKASKSKDSKSKDRKSRGCKPTGDLPLTSPEYLAIFKDGLGRKVEEERQGVERWHDIYPGIAPRILSHHQQGDSAALLIEHLPGMTLEHLLINESSRLNRTAQQALVETLHSVWTTTRRDKPVTAGHMRQLLKRLSDVYQIHPEFRHCGASLCGREMSSLEALIEQAAGLERSLEAPFAVYIHGDFNVDNILFDPAKQSIRFIDLHRSAYQDYVQDVSVHMVSHYRLQLTDAALRARILALALSFGQQMRRFAHEQGDTTFEWRLALGLARSFATSTRFILDAGLAGRMFNRARFILEHVLGADPERPADYRIPLEELFVD